MAVKTAMSKDTIEFNQVYQGDARELAEKLPSKSIAVTLTSPPYWNLKNYGMPNQIGWDQDYDQYMRDMVSIFVQLVASDGIIYINSQHYLNRVVFGAEQEFYEKIKNDYTAQYRFTLLVVEEAVFHLAESMYSENKLIINFQEAPFSSMREVIDKQTNLLAPKIVKAFIVK